MFLRVDTLTALGNEWKTMLDVREVYERELKECRDTFKAIEWTSASMAEAAPTCFRTDRRPNRHSNLGLDPPLVLAVVTAQ